MGINWQIQHYQKITSTQDKAFEAIKDNALEGTVIQALTMESGRGRHGNQWSAPVGNLYLSFILKPDYGVQKAGQVSFVTALAVLETIKSYAKSKHQTVAKWPNDILVDELKISGILLESDIKKNKLESLVVGVGINIFNKPDLAICLNDVAKDLVYVNKVRDNLLDNFEMFYDFWQKDGFLPIREKWLSQAYKLNEQITARLPDKSYHGIFKDIDDNGALILQETNDNLRIIHAAEIYFDS